MNALIDVVVLVAVPVVAQARAVDGALGVLERRPRRRARVAVPRSSAAPGRGLERGQRRARVARRPAAPGASRRRRSSATAPSSPRGSLDRRSTSTPDVVVVQRLEGEQRATATAAARSRENDGFSVVAATSMTQRFSTPGSSASCWALVNRWISSRNRTVSRRTCAAASRASSMHRADVLDARA